MTLTLTLMNYVRFLLTSFTFEGDDDHGDQVEDPVESESEDEVNGEIEDGNEVEPTQPPTRAPGRK